MIVLKLVHHHLLYDIKIASEKRAPHPSKKTTYPNQNTQHESDIKTNLEKKWAGRVGKNLERFLLNHGIHRKNETDET